MRLGRWTSLTALSAVAMLLAPSTQAVHAQGTVIGRVTAATGSLPVPEARILVIGTNVSGTSNADGRYTLRSVPAGNFDLQVLRVGFTSQKKRVTVANGSVTTVDFELATSVVTLDEIVTTATGQQRRAELGNALATLGDVGKKVEQSGTIHDMAGLLVAKAPGVVVLPPIMTGGAPVVRIRGLSSISLTNAPIWIVDGVRFESGTTSLNGQTSFSMLNSLSPEEIEDIEIVKGPSAATLYGTNASNGVVVVTTKKGRAGNTQWNWIAERGIVTDRTDYQTMYANWGHAPGRTTPLRCKIATMVTSKNPNGDCISDSLTSYNLMKDKDLTFVKSQPRSLYGLNVAGGNEGVRFFVSGEVDEELGPIEMPAHEIKRFEDAHVKVRKEWLHPAASAKMNFRANLNASVSPTFDVSVSSGFARNENRLPPSGSAFEAIYYVGMQNYGFKGTGACSEALNLPNPATRKGCLDKGLYSADSVPLNEYFQFAPGDVMQRYRQQIVQRTTMSATANWRPLHWVQSEATVGFDLANRDNSDLCRLGECAPTGVIRLGAVSDAKNNNRTVSGKVSATATWNALSWANFKTSVGADYVNVENDAANSSGVTLPPGGMTVNQAATRDGGQTWPVATKTLGLYIQEQGSFRDRLFVILAVRTDQNSAFGTKFQSVRYPKASVSWLASEESFFPKFSWLNSFRTRLAYGASGVQPGRTDGLATFTAGSQNLQDRTGGTTGSNVPALAANTSGNAELRPELSKEYEAGFDAQALNNRVRFDYTYYRKTTKDALIRVDIAPSSAAAELNPLRNVGSTLNYGHEASMNIQLLDRRRFGWDVTLTGSHESNKVLDLGIDPVTGRDRILNNGSAQQQRVGYPINGRWARGYTYNDNNGDGVLQPAEVTVDSAFSFFGYAFPRDIFSVQQGFDLFSRKLRITAMVDYKGGWSLQDGGNNFQCNTTPFACREVQDPTAPLALQARSVAKNYGTTYTTPAGATTYKTSVGYNMNGQFWKFRELSAVYLLPDVAMRWLRGRSGSNVVLGIRNLRTWTSYTGLDPEEHDGPGDTQSNFQSAPPPTYITVRLNLKY